MRSGKWIGVVKVGVYWDGYYFKLCSGPRWFVYALATVYVFFKPTRCVYVIPQAEAERFEKLCI